MIWIASNVGPNLANLEPSASLRPWSVGYPKVALWNLYPRYSKVATVGFMLLITVVIQWVGGSGAKVEGLAYLEH